MVSWKKVLYVLEVDFFIYVYVYIYLIYIFNSNCIWIVFNKFFGIVIEYLLLFISIIGFVFIGGGSDWYYGVWIFMMCFLIVIFL